MNLVQRRFHLGRCCGGRLGHGLSARSGVHATQVDGKALWRLMVVVFEIRGTASHVVNSQCIWSGVEHLSLFT